MTIQTDAPNASSQLAPTDDIRPEKRSTAAIVLEAAWDLHTRELAVTRETVTLAGIVFRICKVIP